MEKVILDFDYMKKDSVCTNIKVTDSGNILVKNYTDNILDRAFGVNTNISRQDIERLFEERCFPECRHNCKELLKDMGITGGYKAVKIVVQNYGMMFTDTYWIRFDFNKGLSYNEARKVMCL